MEVSSSGKLELISCKIYNNYAIESPLGLIFETVEDSVIDSSEIYNNLAISPAGILFEITTQCELL